jgi:hypothetical protein
MKTDLFQIPGQNLTMVWQAVRMAQKKTKFQWMTIARAKAAVTETSGCQMASSRSATRRHPKFRGTILLPPAYLTFDGDIEGNPHSPMASSPGTLCFARSM